MFLPSWSVEGFASYSIVFFFRNRLSLSERLTHVILLQPRRQDDDPFLSAWPVGEEDFRNLPLLHMEHHPGEQVRKEGQVLLDVRIRPSRTLNPQPSNS